METMAKKSCGGGGFEKKRKDGSELLTDSRESSNSSSGSSSSEVAKTNNGCASPSPLGWPIKKSGECKSLVSIGNGSEEKKAHLEDSKFRKLGSKLSGWFCCFFTFFSYR
jgi:hypothetical protein